MNKPSFETQKFNRLNERISQLHDDKKITDTSQALIYLFLAHRFYREKSEIHETFTDGGNDCGIDAVFIDNKGDHPIIHLFQSKVHNSERKANNPFKYAAVEKVQKFFLVLKDRNNNLDKLVNPLLKQKILQVRDLQDRDFPEFKLWILSNGQPCTPHDLSPLKNDFSNQKIPVEEFHLAEFIEFCLDAHSSREQHVFHAREAGIIEFGDSELRSLVGYISARQLYYLIKDIQDERKIDYTLFDMNVRGFLGLDNPVNKEIFKSASSSNNKHFASFNNGITIVGSHFKVMRTGVDLPKIGVKKFSIVNGAQTCSAIFDSMKDFYPNLDHFDHLSVLFRIFETDNPTLIEKIAVSTNNQNRINPRDLRANDKAQRELEKELKQFKIFYLRKRGFFSGNIQNERKLDALRAGQLILSYTLHDPARAKRDSDSIFTSSYQRIFSKVDVNKLVEALDWFELIEEKRQFIQDEIRIRGATRTENTFVTYGVFHILMLCSILGGDTKPTNRLKIIEKAIEIIEKQLNNAGNPAYYSFFRDTKQTTQLQEAASQPSLFQ